MVGTLGLRRRPDDATLRSFRDEHTARLRGVGVQDIRALTFDVNETLTAVTRGPLATAT